MSIGQGIWQRIIDEDFSDFDDIFFTSSFPFPSPHKTRKLSKSERAVIKGTGISTKQTLRIVVFEDESFILARKDECGFDPVAYGNNVNRLDELVDD